MISRTELRHFRSRAAAPPGCSLCFKAIAHLPCRRAPYGPYASGALGDGSGGVEICCLVIEGRETHRSLACDFHAVAFALRPVVSAFANREVDLSRRKCVAANDQNFARFVTPHDVRIRAPHAETFVRRRRHVH